MKPVDRVEADFMPRIITRKTAPEDLRSNPDRKVFHSVREDGQPFGDTPNIYGGDPQAALGGLPVGREVRVIAKSRPVLVGSGQRGNDVKSKNS